MDILTSTTAVLWSVAQRQSRRRQRPPRRLEPSSAVGWLDRRLLTAAAIGLAVATAVAMTLLWPTGAIPRLKTDLAPSRSAQVTGVRETLCSSGSPPGARLA
jgi:hypothetical protein